MIYPAYFRFTSSGSSTSRKPTAELTCRQHCVALDLEKPPALMRGRAFQKPPRCWRSGAVTGSAIYFLLVNSCVAGRKSRVYEWVPPMSLCTSICDSLLIMIWGLGLPLYVDILPFTFTILFSK